MVFYFDCVLPEQLFMRLILWIRHKFFVRLQFVSKVTRKDLTFDCGVIVMGVTVGFCVIAGEDGHVTWSCNVKKYRACMQGLERWIGGWWTH